MIDRQTIKETALRVADSFDPKAVVLFGSYARGKANEDSDVDLLIIADSIGPRGKRGAPIIRMLAEQCALPVDVIVRTADGLARWQDVPGTLAYQVRKEGVVLYEKEKRERRPSQSECRVPHSLPCIWP